MDKYLIDGHKLFWHLDRVYEWQKNPLICPIYIEVSPVSYCNNRCIFCGVDFARGKDTLNTEKFVNFIQDMGKFGAKSVMFAGEGEPLLHPDIKTLTQETYNAGIDVALVTNGNNLDKNIMNKILDKLTWIRFSVDAGSDEVYTKIHGVQSGIFNKVIKNIENCVKLKKENNLNVTIGVQYLIINDNINDIENSLKLFSKIGIDYFVLKPFSLHPQMQNILQVHYTEKIVKKIEIITNKYSEKLNIIFRKSSLLNYIEYKKNYNHCNALPFWGYLTAKGDFYTCSVFLDDNRFKTGNINNSSAIDIIYGEKRKKSIEYGQTSLDIEKECRVNCRMARINEFLNELKKVPKHVNFI